MPRSTGLGQDRAIPLAVPGSWLRGKWDIHDRRGGGAPRVRLKLQSVLKFAILTTLVPLPTDLSQWSPVNPGGTTPAPGEFFFGSNLRELSMHGKLWRIVAGLFLLLTLSVPVAQAKPRTWTDMSGKTVKIGRAHV